MAPPWEYRGGPYAQSAPMFGRLPKPQREAHDTPNTLHCTRERSYGKRANDEAVAMLAVVADAHRSARKAETGRPLDLQSHLAALKARGLLLRVDRPINKDTELHPLVRWQFQGGLKEDQRRAFLFTNVIDSSGHRYDIPVAVGALAASPQIYAVGMGRPVEEIEASWMRAIASPIPPVLIDTPACQAVVITGEELRGSGQGLAGLPVPISTPGFDGAPYLTATLCVTRDPETGIQNTGTYHAALKAPDRLGVRMAARIGGAGGYLHWKKHKRRGEPMPCAIVIGCAPVFASIISQVTPSESSVRKKVAMEPLFLAHLRQHLGIKEVRRVAMHEPLSNLRKILFVQYAHGTPRTEIWRGLHGAATLLPDCGKVCIAVSEDIDPTNADAVFWSLAYRSKPTEDVHIAPHRSTGHGPKSGPREEDSAILIDATLKHSAPPLALPAREFMERARTIWQELELPALTPQAPWHGYSLGDWSATWDLYAQRAIAGQWPQTGKETFARRQAGLIPETPVREVEGQKK